MLLDLIIKKLLVLKKNFKIIKMFNLSFVKLILVSLSGYSLNFLNKFKLFKKKSK
jgi:hypothetical protein